MRSAMRFLVLVVVLVAGAALAGSIGAGGVGVSPSAGQLNAQLNLETTAPLNLFVDTTGNDSNPCTATGTSACRNIEAALSKIPKRIRHPVEVTVGVGAFDGGIISGFTIDPASPTVGAWLVVQGTQALWGTDGGPNAGAATSATAGSQSSTTWGTLGVADAGWGTNSLRGKWIVTTSGTGSGQNRLIMDNTGDAITVGGAWETTPVAGSTRFEIRDTATQITAGQRPPLLPTDIQTTTCGFQANNVNAATRGNTTSTAGAAAAVVLRYFDFSSAGLARSIRVSSDGNFRISQNKVSAGLRFIDDFQGSSIVAIDNYVGPSSTPIKAYSTRAESSSRASLLSIGNLYTYGGSGAWPVFGSLGGFGDIVSRGDFYLTTGTAQGDLFNVVSASGTLDITGFRADCNGTSTIVRMNNTNALGNNLVRFVGAAIDNCATAFALTGPITLSLATTSGTGNGTVFSISRGSTIHIESTDTITGTTEVSLDGVTYTLAQVRSLSPTGIFNQATGSYIFEKN